MNTNTVLRDLKPDTEYKVTVVPVYPDMEGKRTSENGKTSKHEQNQQLLRAISIKYQYMMRKHDLSKLCIFGDRKHIGECNQTILF